MTIPFGKTNRNNIGRKEEGKLLQNRVKTFISDSFLYIYGTKSKNDMQKISFLYVSMQCFDGDDSADRNEVCRSTGSNHLSGNTGI